MKYIFVCGGVISGVGKGIATASIGTLLKLRGFNVAPIKLDGYGNIDSGTIRPSDHGECMVLDDKKECDLDLGHYERFLAIDLTKKNICTSGTIYKELMENEEKGAYLGSTIQIVPHFVNAVQKRIIDVGEKADIVICEIGGTIGDIESLAFYEAIRQFQHKENGNVLVIMVAPILWIPTVGEYKTKPLQNAVRDLQHLGINPDILLCRADKEVSSKLLDKISNMTGVDRDCVFCAPDVDSIYQVPVEFYDRHIDDTIADLLHLKRTRCLIHKHRELIEKKITSEITIGVFGKYDNADSYISIKEALFHAGLADNCKVNIKWIKSDELEGTNNVKPFFEGLNGVVVPGGFDSRGIEGKIKAIQYAREKKIPFLGICLGLQCAVIEFARNVCNLKANSMEFDKNTPEPVIHYVKGQENIAVKSASMRLGAYDCELSEGSIAISLYGKKIVSERHRHRLEVNPKYLDCFGKNNFKVSGTNPQSGLVEIMELDKKDHPYFIGTQAHPEFRSRLESPSPLFKGLINAAKLFK